MTPAQCREARALLGWTEDELSAHCGLAAATIVYFEAGRGRSRRRTPYALRTAFEAAGVEFVLTSGVGVVASLSLGAGNR